MLNNSPFLKFFFSQTTQVKLLCPETCDEGHICRFIEGHSGKHVCVFGHTIGEPVIKCGHICDCRGCNAECTLRPGHYGIHKCYFRHYPSDIPSNRVQQE